MRHYYFYGHGGSHNHGCEALLTSISQLILNRYPDAKISVSTLDETADRKFVGNDFTYYGDHELNGMLQRYIFAAFRKYLHNDSVEAKLTYRNFKSSLNKQDKDTCFISIGGDNYCCEKPTWLYYLNSLIDCKGYRRVLFGCTIEEKWLNEEMIRDLEGYSLITARDRVSYEALTGKLHDTQIEYMPDTAFGVLPKKTTYIVPNNTIGINLSPFAIKKGRSPALKKCYEGLIKYILGETKYNILFIPHVYIEGNDDRTVMGEFAAPYKDNERVFVLEDEYSYAELRYIISQLDVLICARTHASISGYAMFVPTLVLGYSGKSHQIAKELFGTDKGYVIDVNEKTTSNDLIDSLTLILNNLEEFRTVLKSKVPQYVGGIELPENM